MFTEKWDFLSTEASHQVTPTSDGQSAVTSAESLFHHRLSESDDSSWALCILLRHTKHSLASVDDAKQACALSNTDRQCGAAVLSCCYLLNTTQQLILRPLIGTGCISAGRPTLCYSCYLLLRLLKPVNWLFDNSDRDNDEDLFNIPWRLASFLSVRFSASM